MRSPEEIEAARRHLEDALKEGIACRTPVAKAADLQTSIALLLCIEWVQGSCAPGGFGEMLAELDQVDCERNGRAEPAARPDPHPLFDKDLHDKLREKHRLFCAKCGYGDHLTLECHQGAFTPPGGNIPDPSDRQ